VKATTRATATGATTKGATTTASDIHMNDLMVSSLMNYKEVKNPSQATSSYQAGNFDDTLFDACHSRPFEMLVTRVQSFYEKGSNIHSFSLRLHISPRTLFIVVTDLTAINNLT